MSFTPAKAIASPQQGPHEKLELIVRKHFEHPNQKSIDPHNHSAFQQAREHWEGQASGHKLWQLAAC